MKDKPKSTEPKVNRELWLRRHSLTTLYGTIPEQQTALVKTILEAFQRPDRWPLTDTQRIELLRDLYTRAIRVRDLEQVTTSLP